MKREIGAALLALMTAGVLLWAPETRRTETVRAEPAETPVVQEEQREDPGEEPEVQSAVCQLTAYCPCELCCGQWAGGNTASGTVPEAGRTVGVDPEVIPLGATVYIYGRAYRAEDTGAFTGNIIDIYMDSHQEALQFGRQEATVTWES